MLPKASKLAQSPINHPIWSHCQRGIFHLTIEIRRQDGSEVYSWEDLKIIAQVWTEHALYLPNDDDAASEKQHKILLEFM